MVNERDWFIEWVEAQGTAFGLKLGEKLHAERSAFQEIEIYQTERFGRLMVIDGCVMLTDRDNFLYHEMLTHPALCMHPDPARVLIIGGGDCGTLREVLRHDDVQQVTQVEIDERVTRLAETYFPELCASNGDPRAQLLFDDGIAHVAAAAPDSLDLILVDSTDPVGPAEGLFNVDFYRSCARALADGGLLVQQTESPLLHLDLIRAVHRAQSEAGFGTHGLISFPQPVYPSGWWSATVAARGAQLPPLNEARARTVEARTQYYNRAIHQAALAQPNFVRDALAG